MNIGVNVSFQIFFEFFQINTEKQICWIIWKFFYYYFFKELPYCFPWQEHYCAFSLMMHKGSNFSTFLLTVIFFYIYNCHPGRWKMISYCDFYFNFHAGQWCWTSFYIFVDHFFEDMSIHILSPYCYLFCCCCYWFAWILYTLDISPYHLYGLQIFSLIT